MVKLKWTSGILVLAGLGLAGGLAWSNPDQAAFESYATSQLSTYLEENLCRELASPLDQLINLPCKDLLETNQGVLYEVIRDRTQRYNFIFFSFYRTTLALPFFDLLPTYQIDTLGIGGHFYTINARQR